MRGLLLAAERLHKTLQQAIEDLLRPYDLSVAQWLIISGMAEDHGHTLTHFAQQLDRDAGSLSRAIYQLSQRGLLRHQRNLHDRRSRSLSLTPEGRRIRQDVVSRLTRLLLAIDHGQVDAGHAPVSSVLADLAGRVERCRQQMSLACFPHAARAACSNPANLDAGRSEQLAR